MQMQITGVPTLARQITPALHIDRQRISLTRLNSDGFIDNVIFRPFVQHQLVLSARNFRVVMTVGPGDPGTFAGPCLTLVIGCAQIELAFFLAHNPQRNRRIIGLW